MLSVKADSVVRKTFVLSSRSPVCRDRAPPAPASAPGRQSMGIAPESRPQCSSLEHRRGYVHR